MACLVLAVSFEVSAADVLEQDPQGDNEPVPTEPVKALQAALTPAKNVDLKEVLIEPLQRLEAVVAKEPARDATVNVEEVPVPGARKVNNPVAPELSTVQVGDSPAVISEVADTASAPLAIQREASREATGSPAPEEPAAQIKDAGQDVSQLPLVLLQSEVMPGTTTRLSWSPSVSFMGISAPTAVLVLNGVKPGPTLCLTAAVHGDELNGIEIVRRVLYNIDPKELSGSIVGVPIVNLEGFRGGSRYLADRRDLNRFFPGNPDGSSAARIAHSFFHEVVSHCDMLIDLHTGSFRRTNLPQLRADLNYPEVDALSRKMGAIVVLQSEGAQGSLRRAATENGIPAVTLEAGAPHELQKSAVEYGVKSVENALNGLGLIDRRKFWQSDDEPVYYKSTWVRAREGGILLSEVALGKSVKQGELLGAVTDPITNQRDEIRSPHSGRVIGMASNQVMHPGFAAYHIGIEASVSDAIAEQASESEEGESSAGALPNSGLRTALLTSTGDDDRSGEEDTNASLYEPGEESDE